MGSQPEPDLAKRGLGSCVICYDDMFAAATTVDTRVSALCPCGHMYHTHCISDWFSKNTKQECPQCRVAMICCIMLNGHAPMLDDDKNIDASALVAGRIRELRQKREDEKKDLKKVKMLDEQIEEATLDKDRMNYLRLLHKLKKGATLILPHEASRYGHDSQEMKFLYMLCAKEEKRNADLLDKREVQNKLLQNLDSEKRMTLVNCEELKNQIKYLKRQCLEQGIDPSAALKRIEDRQNNYENTNNNNITSTQKNNNSNNTVFARQNTSAKMGIRLTAVEISALNVNQKMSGKIRSRVEAGNDNDRNNNKLKPLSGGYVRQGEGKKNDGEEDDNSRPGNTVEEMQNKGMLMMEFLQQESTRTDRTPIR